MSTFDRNKSVMVQAYEMDGPTFDKNKDALILNPTMKPEESLVIMPPSLAFFEPWTKVTIYTPILTWVPLCVFIWTRIMTEHTIWTFAAFGLAFGFGWPLTEYLLHRFVFHMPVLWAPKQIQGYVNVFRLLAHTIHHAHPTDRLRIATPLPMSLVVASVLIPLPFLLVKNWNIAHSWNTGMILGYLTYDLTHYYMHFGAPSRLPEWLPTRKWLMDLHLAHANHHYAQDGYRESFGVGHMFWDDVFGTAKGSFDKNNRKRK